MELKIKKKTTLRALAPGSLFIHNGTIAVKSEYYIANGAIEAIIVGSGCFFWGGTDDPNIQLSLEVIEVELTDWD